MFKVALFFTSIALFSNAFAIEQSNCKKMVDSYLSGETMLGISDKTAGSKSQRVRQLRDAQTSECEIQRQLTGVVPQ